MNSSFGKFWETSNMEKVIIPMATLYLLNSISVFGKIFLWVLSFQSRNKNCVPSSFVARTLVFDYIACGRHWFGSGEQEEIVLSRVLFCSESAYGFWDGSDFKIRIFVTKCCGSQDSVSVYLIYLSLQISSYLETFVIRNSHAVMQVDWTSLESAGQAIRRGRWWAACNSMGMEQNH